MSVPTLKVEQVVRDRYDGAANDRVDESCCPVDYDSQYLEVIPQEIIDRD